MLNNKIYILTEKAWIDIESYPSQENSSNIRFTKVWNL